jgi:hypothetical protein
VLKKDAREVRKVVGRHKPGPAVGVAEERKIRLSASGVVMRYVLQLMVVVLVWGNMEVVQALDTGSRESLRGISGIGVIVEEISPDASADGLSQDAIRTAAELILRSKGIRVLTNIDRTRLGSVPYLYININTLKEELGLYAYAVNVDLKQVVGLLSMKGAQAWGATWSASVVGAVGEANMRQIIADGVEPLVNDFARDYLSVNPR